MESKKTINEGDDTVLMQDTFGTVIIVKNPKAVGTLKGTVVYTSQKGYSLGYYSEKWDADQFKEFRGTILLKN